MIVATTRADLATSRAELVPRVGLVPTMGALHAGHAALLAVARADCASVAVSIFVNPLQFGVGEDLARYPRPLEADLAICERAGADLVWAPSVAEMFPAGQPEVTVAAGPLGAELEGASRPGHFAGVLTAVAKLIGLIRPDAVYFGEKDYQQQVLVRRMVADLELGVDVISVPTVRDADGLAISSRNTYLSPVERRYAPALSRALRAGRDAGGAGADAVLGAAQAVLDEVPEAVVDYLALRAPDLGPPPAQGPARLLVAAKVGTARLIDNAEVIL
jgi:pantoate--beta-alanine ligase